MNLDKGAVIKKRLLIVNDTPGQEKPRSPRSDELTEILDVVLAMLIRSNQGEKNLVKFLEERLTRIALEQTSNNKSRASENLGIHRKQLERKVKKYHLSDG